MQNSNVIKNGSAVKSIQRGQYNKVLPMNKPYNFSIPLSHINNTNKCFVSISISVKEGNYDYSQNASYILNSDNITIDIDMGEYLDYKLDVRVSYSIIEFY